MKKLLVALMVLTTLASCGKNNSVSSGAPGSSTTALTSATANASNLASMITNYSSNFGVSWAQMLANQPNLTYYYFKAANAASSCQTKWTIFYVCSSNTSSATISRQVVNSSVNIASKQAELMAIVNKSSRIQQNGSAVYIYTTDAKLYIFDLSLPIQAQPTQIQDSTSTEFFGYGM